MSYMYSEYNYIQNIYIISQRITKCQAKNEKKAIKNNVQDAMLKGGETSSEKMSLLIEKPSIAFQFIK